MIYGGHFLRENQANFPILQSIFLGQHYMKSSTDKKIGIKYVILSEFKLREDLTLHFKIRACEAIYVYILAPKGQQQINQQHMRGLTSFIHHQKCYKVSGNGLYGLFDGFFKVNNGFLTLKFHQERSHLIIMYIQYQSLLVKVLKNFVFVNNYDKFDQVIHKFVFLMKLRIIWIDVLFFI